MTDLTFSIRMAGHYQKEKALSSCEHLPCPVGLVVVQHSLVLRTVEHWTMPIELLLLYILAIELLP